MSRHATTTEAARSSIGKRADRVRAGRCPLGDLRVSGDRVRQVGESHEFRLRRPFGDGCAVGGASLAGFALDLVTRPRGPRAGVVLEGVLSVLCVVARAGVSFEGGLSVPCVVARVGVSFGGGLSVLCVAARAGVSLGVGLSVLRVAAPRAPGVGTPRARPRLRAPRPRPSGSAPRAPRLRLAPLREATLPSCPILPIPIPTTLDDGASHNLDLDAKFPV